MTTVDPEKFAERLAAAELVCILYGFTGVGEHDGDRADAALQAWMDWYNAYPEAMTPKPRDPLWDRRIKELAARRRATRAAVLEKLIAVDPVGDAP